MNYKDYLYTDAHRDSDPRGRRSTSCTTVGRDNTSRRDEGVQRRESSCPPLYLIRYNLRYILLLSCSSRSPSWYSLSPRSYYLVPSDFVGVTAVPFARSFKFAHPACFLLALVPGSHEHLRPPAHPFCRYHSRVITLSPPGSCGPQDNFDAERRSVVAGGTCGGPKRL